MFFGFGVTFGRTIEKRICGSTANLMVPNSGGLDGSCLVGNELSNYITFDVRSFLTEPFVCPFQDRGGRQYFWNYLLKTGLVGEFSYDSSILGTLTLSLSGLLLLMLLYTGGGLLIFCEHLGKHGILLLNMIILILASMAIRVSIPASCSNDFRYILPILISFVFFFGYSIWFYRLKGWRWLEKTGYGLATGFIAISNLFFILLWFH
jgi:hypothetical protein